MRRNLFQRVANVRRLVNAVYSRDSAPDPTDSNIIERLSDAYARAYQILRIGEKLSLSNLISGTDTYAIPQGAGADFRVSVRAPGSAAGETHLKRIQQSDLRRLYDSLDSTVNVGTPIHWVRTERTIVIRPTPNYTRASGLVFRYRPTVEKLWRIYNQSTVTLSATYGSVTLTCSADPNTAGVNVVADDMIGMLATNQDDGTVDPTSMPRVWYRIESVSGATLTLYSADAWAERTASGLQFISAQVCELEDWCHGELGESIDYLAAASILLPTMPDKYEMFQRMGEERIRSIDLGLIAEDVGTMDRTIPFLDGASRGHDAALTRGVYPR